MKNVTAGPERKRMNFDFEERPSDSSLIEKIWRTGSERAGTFISEASVQSEMVVMKHQGRISVAVRGPETRATVADCPADAEFLGIVFRVGTFIPSMLPQTVRNRNDAVLPEAGSGSFLLDGSAWELPTFENADTFIARLMRRDLLVRDPAVDALLLGVPTDLSLRQLQRRFLRATGLTWKGMQQIERARHALELLEQGLSISDTIYRVGYFDQPHLTRAMQRFMGRTPARIIHSAWEE